ncbi:unnamed protein product [Brassica rapa subsp. trilocularis]
MESPETVSSGFPPLPTEPPDPDLDVMLPVTPPVPPVPPDPPPVLLDCAFIHHISSSFTTPHHRRDQEALMPWFLCASTGFRCSSLTTSQVSSFFQLIPVSKPRNLVACVEHDSLKSPLRDLPYYHQVEILVARFLGLLTTDCKLTFLHGSSIQVLEDWTSKVEILVVVSILYAVVITSAQSFGVQFSIVMCSSKSMHILHLKLWLHVVGPISPCFLLSQGIVFISCWSESFLFDNCLRIDCNWLRKRSLIPGNQEIMLLLNGSLPRSEDVTNPLSFRFKLPFPQYGDATLYRTRLLPHCEAVIWTSVFMAMDSVGSGLSIWRWCFTSQQPIFWKRSLVASELVGNFPHCSANGTWIVSSALQAKDGMLQEAPHSTLSSGPSSLQILSDFIVPFSALRTGLDLIEITGYFVRNLVPLVTPLSCSFNLCNIFVLVVVVYAMGAVPKL